MADTVEPTETTQQAPSEVTPSAPAVDNAEAIAAEKKRAEQAEMERNLLRKRLEALEKEKSEKERKELEDKEDWKSLAEQAVARAEALEKEREAESTAKARDAATSEVFGGFDNKVIEIAKTTGLTAADDSDEAKEALRSKLEAIQSQVGITKQPTPTPNNPGEVVPTDNAPQYVSLRDAGDIDGKAASIWKNNRAAHTQLKNSTAIAAMKQISGMTPQEI